MLTLQVSATRLYSARSVGTSAIVPYCTMGNSRPPNRRMKQSARNALHSVNLQEVCLGKTLLVDVYSQCSPHLTKCVYAIVDEQSNSSLVTSELANDLGAGGPLEKYYLSTCSGEREERPVSSGHHSTGYQWSRVCLAYPHRVRYHPTGQT